ncbi:hypothetical protein [Ectopseudomonas oleovorans]|nr:hypothetical protein [Pseudomonas oleovorans]MDH2200673.1 hypothetical protein [Pseudomonas oleovorans]
MLVVDEGGRLNLGCTTRTKRPLTAQDKSTTADGGCTHTTQLAGAGE